MNELLRQQTVEKGDFVAIKDGHGGTMEVEVMSVKPDYEKNSFLRFDYINHQETSPMRRTAWPSDMIRVLRKNPNPLPDPKAIRPYDNPIGGKPDGSVIIDGKVYVPQGKAEVSKDPAAIINPEASQTQVHDAVKSPSKPVGGRIKKSK